MSTVVEYGQKLADLCMSDHNRYSEIRHLLDDLSEDERRQVVNDRDSTGTTPLHHVAARNRSQTAELLIMLGADVHAEEGEVPLI